MTIGRVLLAGLIVMSGGPDSRAEPAPPAADLRARGLPFLPRLAMRTAARATAAPTARVPAAAAEPPPASATDRLRFDRTTARAPTVLTADERRALIAEQVRAQLTLGFAVDGAEPSGSGRTVAGNSLRDGELEAHLARVGYARARAYGFGEAVLGVDGVGIAGISVYLAAQFRLAPSAPTFAPVANAWDQLDPLRIRAGWAEADRVFEKGILRPLVLRGGRQFIYGPAIAHVDGLWASWERSGVRLTGYFGARVPDWYQDNPGYPDARRQGGVVTGGELAVDLRQYRLPFKLKVRALAFENHGHTDVTVDWSARPDLIATGVVRLFDGEIVREHVTLRYRVSDETRLVVDGDVRQRRDPIWDYAFYRADERFAARRYLDLGPSLPRIAGRARAGTVILDNVDVLVHAGFAVDARGTTDEPSYHAASWFETGGALEVRVRRAVALGLSALIRNYSRRDPEMVVRDREDEVQPLELQPLHLGERSLIEGGGSARFSSGARRFSAAVEIYLRKTKFAERYQDDGSYGRGAAGLGDDELVRVLGPDDFRGGGRISFEAWITPNLRMRAEYDVSSRLDLAPEILGLKSLRLVAEGTF